MNNNKWHKLMALIVIPAVMFLYYNRSANWHYHITENGIVVEHAHPFSNSLIPDTPFQDHEHSEAEYLFLAEMMHSLALVLVILLLLGPILRPKRLKTLFPLPDFLTNNGSQPIIPRGPPATIGL